MSAVEIVRRLNLKKSGRSWCGACSCCGYKTTFILREQDDQARGRCVSCDDWQAIRGLLDDLQEATAPAIADPRSAAPELPFEDRVARALRTWIGAAPVVGTPAEAYLANRGLSDLIGCAALRWRPDTWHPAIKATIRP